MRPSPLLRCLPALALGMAACHPEPLPQPQSPDAPPEATRGAVAPDTLPPRITRLEAPPLAAVSVGGRHACGLTPAGEAYCWGDGEEGRLGRGDITGSVVPVAVRSAATFRALAAGQDQTCGVTADGEVLCWGALLSGVEALLPARIPSDVRFTSLSAGAQHVCGLSDSRRGYCWGSGAYGQNGTGTGVYTEVPTPVAGSLTLAAVDAGATHTCALAESGAPYCWGFGSEATLGTAALESCEQADDPFARCAPRPVPVETGLRFRTISAGSGYTCAITPERALYCWGSLE
jgi:alpha-tubulin suppressor-like RCC1 family protein